MTEQPGRSSQAAPLPPLADTSEDGRSWYQVQPLSHRPPLPHRFWAYAALAYLVPVALQVLVPEDPLRADELVWLVTLVPAFVLAMHYGLRGALVALLAGTTLFSVVQFVVATNFAPDDWRITVPIYVAYSTLAISVGWLSEQLHRYYRRAEETIQVEKAYLERLFESAPEAIVILSPDDRIQRANTAFLDLFGYTMDEVRHRTINELIVPVHLREEARRLTEGVAEGEPVRIETVRKRSDGTMVDVSISGSPVRVGGGAVAIYGIYRDITERKRAEQALKAKEERYRRLVDDNPGFICSHDLEGDILSVNPAAAHTIGVPQDKLRGKRLDSFLVPDARARFDQYLEHVQLDGTARGTFRLLRPDGEERIVAYRNVLHQDDEGEGYVVCHGQDITDQVRAEERLELALAEADATNRAKSRFLEHLSLEFRNPLNAVLGFSGVLLDKGKSISEQERDFVERIRSNGIQLLNLIDQIMDLSKVQVGSIRMDFESTDVGELVSEVMEELEPRVRGRDLELTAVIPEETVPIDADPRRLKQILVNLTGNAIKFTASGTVKLEVLPNPDTKRPVRIDVSDTGVGIPPERLETIFEPFEQTTADLQESYRGVGLGLSVSKSLCEIMGFQLDVRSEVGKGTTFSVVIPTSDQVRMARESQAHVTLEQSGTDD